eukprot:TRINITY_DN1111_c0_g1_i2.p2 TRINITY_DN1111_c0_g1~~TRINITY_DN1111_c0_g1_i2.p2  ORF type:complete len:238 (+),score=47.25 TRINITY_DN1111_c0_g1_i2:1766-2479(+)
MARRCFLQIDILPDGIEEWHASYDRMLDFLKDNHAMYGLPSSLDDCNDDQKEMLEDVYNGDSTAVAKGPGRVDKPPSKTAGRLNIELFDKQVPKTCDNFYNLCTGAKGKGKSGKELHFKDTPVHRVLKGFCLQSGDIVKGDGSAGDSIYGGKFNDEKPGLKLKHDARGILSMANSGKNSNTSQFFITFGPQPKLDGKHVVFGKVVDGLAVLDIIEAAAGEGDGPPMHRIVISDCGAC